MLLAISIRKFGTARCARAFLLYLYDFYLSIDNDFSYFICRFHL